MQLFVNERQSRTAQAEREKTVKKYSTNNRHLNSTTKLVQLAKLYMIVSKSHSSKIKKHRRSHHILNKMFMFDPSLRLRLVTVVGVLLSAVHVQRGSALPSSAASNKNNNILKVLILRHGQSDANAANVIQGSGYVSRLTQLGQDQARQAAMGAFTDDDIDAVYCSPLGRAQKTWQIMKETLPGAFDNLEATTLQDLREIDFYDWEGLDKTNLAKLFPDSFRAWKQSLPHELVVYESAPHTSEPTKHYPLLEMWERADQVWNEIFEREAILFSSASSSTNTKKNKCILVVAHGSLGQALLGTAMGWDATYFRQYTFPNCGIAEIEWNLDNIHNDDAVPQHRRPRASRWKWRWPNQKSHGWRSLETAQLQKAEGVHEGASRSG